MVSLAELLVDSGARLETAGVENPGVDAEIIVGHVIGEGRGRVQALAFMGRALKQEQADRIEQLVAERERRVPLQHLTGRAPFRSLDLEVGPGVFVPRPETEIVAGIAINALQAVPDPEPIAVDFCTGSGALALALATEVPTASVHAVELSPEAHAWASRNVAALGDGRVTLHLGDVRELDAPEGAGLDELRELVGRVHVLVSNPPYVPDAMVPRDPEVRDHDPDLALYGGSDGLDLVRVISRVGRQLVVPGGAIVLEHAEQQGAAIRSILKAEGWSAAATHPDLTGRDRATTAVR